MRSRARAASARATPPMTSSFRPSLVLTVPSPPCCAASSPFPSNDDPATLRLAARIGGTCCKVVAKGKSLVAVLNSVERLDPRLDTAAAALREDKKAAFSRRCCERCAGLSLCELSGAVRRCTRRL